MYEIVTLGAGIETFFKVVGRTLTFELERFGLEGAVTWSAEMHAVFSTNPYACT